MPGSTLVIGGNVLAEGNRKKNASKIMQNFWEKIFLVFFSLLYHFLETSLLINNYYKSITTMLYGNYFLLNNELLNTGNTYPHI